MAGLFDKLSKKAYYSILLLKALEIKNFVKFLNEITYLYREFYISTQIKPVIKEYIISFYYKDNQLHQFRTNDLKDLIKVAEQIKKSRIEQE